MKVFELHFNQKKKNEEIFDSFVFEPETPSEKPMGNLYMIGEFAKILPQNSRFLNNLSKTIKEEYYQKGELGEALKKANEFLDKEARSGNVNWLGNLHFTVLSLISQKNSWKINLSSTGETKVLLSREGDLLDIGHNLEMRETEPYPLKIFGNIVTGKVASNDKLILLTKNVFSLLSKKGNFLNQIKNISDEKELKKLLNLNKKLLSETAGICLLLLIPPEANISYKQPARQKITGSKIPAVRFPTPAFKYPFADIIKKRSVRLIIAFLLVLLAGSLIFNVQQKEQEKQEKTQTIEQLELLELAEAKIDEAENRISILQDTEGASKLLLEAQNIIAEIGEEAEYLREKIDEILNMINGG